MRRREAWLRYRRLLGPENALIVAFTVQLRNSSPCIMIVRFYDSMILVRQCLRYLDPYGLWSVCRRPHSVGPA